MQNAWRTSCLIVWFTLSTWACKFGDIGVVRYDASYPAAGEFFEAKPGSREYWLTARYCLYSANRSGRIFRGEIDHPPWSLAPATYTERTNTMGKPFGFEFQGEPHLLYAKSVDVRARLAITCEDH